MTLDGSTSVDFYVDAGYVCEQEQPGRKSAVKQLVEGEISFAEYKDRIEGGENLTEEQLMRLSMEIELGDPINEKVRVSKDAIELALENQPDGDWQVVDVDALLASMDDSFQNIAESEANIAESEDNIAKSKQRVAKLQARIAELQAEGQKIDADRGEKQQNIKRLKEAVEELEKARAKIQVSQL